MDAGGMNATHLSMVIGPRTLSSSWAGRRNVASPGTKRLSAGAPTYVYLYLELGP